MGAYFDRYYSAAGVLCQVAYTAGKIEGPGAFEVAAWLDRLTVEFGHPALVAKLGAVVVISPNHAGAPEGFRSNPPIEGLYTQTNKVIWLSSQAANPDLLAHELGHHVALHLPEQLAEAFRTAYGTQDRPVIAGAKDFFRAVARMGGW